MSEVKVNKITPTADCGTVTLGDSGDTIAIPAGTTVTAPSANVTNSGTVNSTTITNSGTLTNSGTITNTGTISGGTISGTIDGSVNWQTTVKTTGFTATAGEGYFCNTTSAAFTVTLPASPSAGDIVGIKDYANTADTNNITIARNGSNIQGEASNYLVNTEGLAIVLLYVDATKGWLSVGQSKASDITEEPLFTTATGGTITTCGDYKIHTFTGPGTFCVSQIGNGPTNPNGGPTTVSYMVVAGGGSGAGSETGGGGGAGGFREGRDITPSYTASPLVNSSGLTITATGFPVTVGGGGSPTPSNGCKGSNSVFSTITSTGGGFGANNTDGPGGSGGGGGRNGSNGTNGSGGGTGNQPPVSPPQGNPGGRRFPYPSPGGNPNSGGGGGGATASGGNGSSPTGGSGGAGATTSISGSPTTYAGGGGGGGERANGGSGGSGGGAAGIRGGCGQTGNAATANTGGGGGGTGWGHPSTPGSGSPAGAGGAGGSGIVIIRYKFQ